MLEESVAISTSLTNRSTVAEVVAYWLATKQSEVRSRSFEGYKQAALYVVGPLLVGTRHQRAAHTRWGINAGNAQLLQMLGDIPLTELTTATIRQWQQTLTSQVSAYTAAIAKKHLKTALALAAEDFNLDPPKMPRTRARVSAARKRRLILTPSQVGILLSLARGDPRGLYYAFPFLAGTRPSEQLGLLWEDVDLAGSVISIRRTLQLDSTLSDLTKSAASYREIPITPLLKTMLVEWQSRCPSQGGLPGFVFPCLGNGGPHYKKRGWPLGYNCYLKNYWRPVFRRCSLPYVTPHTARHTYISSLQANGVEVGLVAKLVGHEDANVTLGYYTQAVRDGFAAVSTLDAAYGMGATQ